MQKRKWIRTLACTMAVLLLTQNQGIVYAAEASQTENSVQNAEEPVKEESGESKEDSGVKQDEEDKNVTEDPETETGDENGTEDPETETDGEPESEENTGENMDDTEVPGEAVVDETDQAKDSLLKVVDETENVILTESDEDIFTYDTDRTIITGLKEGVTVTNIKIPDNICEIKDRAFANEKSIISVSLPNSLIKIGESAFAGTGITEVVIPENVTTIGMYAFKGCSQLTSVNIKSTNLSSTMAWIFSGCNIKDITLPEGMTKIPGSLFYGADVQYKTEVTIPASVEIIGDSAFSGVENLCKINFAGNKVREIGESAFAGTGITEVVIPENVTTIGMYAYKDCSQVTSVNIKSTNLSSTMAWIFSGCNIKDITLPEGMVKIPNCLFCGADVQYETVVTIPSSVEVIGDSAFSGVANLSRIIFVGNNVREIGESAFEKTGITEVVIPEKVTTIGMYAFRGCSQVTSVDIKSTKLTSTRTSIFSGCNIKDITLPEGMVKIPNCLFSGADVQYNTEVTIPASVEIIGDHAFSGLDKLCKINFAGNKVREIGESAFEKTGITEVIIPGNVKTIDWYAFRGCSSLVKVVIPSSVTSIGYGAFANCNSDIKFYVTSGSYASKWAADNKLSIVTNYSIKYNLNGGTNAADNPYVYETGDSIEFAAPTRKGYTFEGWCKDSTYKKKIENTANESGNLNLYAKWKVINYTITYELDGGQVTGNPVQYDVTKTFKLKEPKKTGYKFLGWYLDKGEEEPVKVTTISKGTVGDLVLTAKWKENQYNIKFMGNGGRTEEGNSSVTVTHLYSLERELISNSFSRLGYDFIGWNTKKDGKGTTYNDRELVSKLSSSDNAVITLYAMWETEKYWITYELNGDDVQNSNPSYYTVSKDVMLKNPVNPGYTFGGWYTDEEFTQKITKINKNTASDIILFAKWNENKYNVSFNLNGGKGTAAKLTNVGYTDEIVLPSADAVTRDGYTLKEWNTKKDGKGTSYGLEDTSFKANNIPTKNGSTLTLYAIWEPVQYLITYHLNGAGENPNPSYYTVQKDVKLQTPIKKGYAFQGWYSDAEYKNKVTIIRKGTKTAITLYAKWSENTNVYNVAFNLNGGKGTVATIRNVGYDDEISLPTGISRTGYDFEGWNTRKDGKGTNYTDSKVSQLDVKNGGTITLYAKWKAIEHQITYENMEDVTVNNNPSVYTIQKDVSLKTPIKPGYTFKGWYGDESFRNKISKISKTGTKDVTVYAKWEVNTYSVKFNANGGKGSADQRNNLTYGQNIVLPDGEAFVREGYELVGWNTRKDEKGISYDAGVEIEGIDAKNKSTVTLYAVWQPIEYTITYLHKDEAGAEVATEDIINKNPSTYTIEKNIWLDTPSKTGYTFCGWYTQDEKRVILIKRTKTENITLHAVWKSNTYSVRFSSNGGTGSMDKMSDCVYDKAIFLSKNQFEREGYQFSSWNTRRDGTGDSYADGTEIRNLASGNKASVTLYAQWEKE